MDELAVLWEVPEACMVRVGHFVVNLSLTSVRSERLPEMEAAFRRAHEEVGRPLRVLSTYRMDCGG